MNLLEHKRRHSLYLALVLVAMGLRVLYVPIHLALEEHAGPDEHPLAHAFDTEVHADHDHGDHDHEPHTALDHASALILQRAPSQGHTVFDWLALPHDESWTLPVPGVRFAATRVLARPPERRPGGGRLPRGPPAAV